jgi:hypothetical protein
MNPSLADDDNPGGDKTPSPRSAAAVPAPRLDDNEAPPAGAPAAAPDEEVDVWWGSYSPWTLLPGFVGTLLLTGLIGWAAWLLVHRGWIEFTFFTVGALLWAVQTVRWCHRLFGYNYRLTNRRLFRDYGVLHPDTVRVNLADVAHVSLRKVALGQLVGVGQLRLVLEDKSQVVLDGVREPGQVADLIRQCVQKARQQKEAS